jgi:hypothetical protein
MRKLFYAWALLDPVFGHMERASRQRHRRCPRRQQQVSTLMRKDMPRSRPGCLPQVIAAIGR